MDGPADRCHEFRELYTASKVTSFIVVVPGVGTHSPETWGQSSGEPWLKTLLLNAAPGSSVVSFDHGLSSDDTFSWKRLVESGAHLLDTLLRLREDERFQEFPLLFVCHSLGGIIMKKALCLAQQDLSRFRNLLGVVSGLIMMGTPHSRSNNEDIWRDVSLIPRAYLKKFSKQPISEAETRMLCSISSQFETIEPPIPILSTYEARSTRIRAKFSTKSTLLVRREFSITHLKYEKSLEVDADHNDLCNFGSKSVAYERVSTFIKEAIEATQRDLFLHLNPEISLDDEHEKDADSTSQIRPSRGPSPGHLNVQASHSQHKVSGSKYNETWKWTRAATFGMISEASSFALKDPTLPCFVHMSHTRNKDFFGQQDVLSKMEETLLPRSSLQAGERPELKTFGLCGLGGMGKTEIAVEFMFAHRDDFDAIFWVQSDEPAKIAEGFCTIALELGLEEPGTIQNQAVSRDLVKRWLTQPLKHCRRLPMPAKGECASWLLILDNVDDPAILKDYWPTEGIGSILITSRDPLARKRAFRTTSGISLPPFKDEDAAQFLIKLAENDSDDEDEDEDGEQGESGNEDNRDNLRNASYTHIPSEALAIAKRLGGLPLALTQMAAVISRNDMTYKEFLQHYDQEQGLKDFLEFNLGDQDTGYKHNLSSVWALDRLGRGASILLDVMSLMDPDRIQEEIVMQGSSDAHIEGYPHEPGEYLKARAELIKASLITRNKNQHIIRVHRLTQDGVRAAMDNEHLQQIFNATVSLISSIWPFVTIDRRHNIARWEKCDALFPHILRLKSLYSRRALQPGIKFAKLLNDVGWYFYERSIPEHCEPFFQLAQQVCECQKEDAIDLLSDIHYSRGADASEVNDPERCMKHTSIFWNMRLEHSKTSQLGIHDIRLAMSYNQMGVAYMMVKDYKSAVEVLEKSFEIYASLDGATPVMATLPAANMGLALWFLGKYDDAYKYLNDMLREREKAFGLNDTESFKTGRILHALGNVRASQGRLRDSFDLHQRALLQYRSTIGDNHHRTADVCYKVAEHYMRFGKLEEAKKLLEQALKVFGSRINYTHEKARADRLMGRLQALMGNETESMKYFAEALNNYRILNPEEPAPSENLSDDELFEGLVCFWSR